MSENTAALRTADAQAGAGAALAAAAPVVDGGLYASEVTLDFSRPGRPTDNGFIAAFNSKLRTECLNAHWFMSLADAREKLEERRRHYTEDSPLSAIGYNVPIAMHYSDGVTSPSS